METALLQVKSKDIQNFGAKTKDPALWPGVLSITLHCTLIRHCCSAHLPDEETMADRRWAIYPGHTAAWWAEPGTQAVSL